MSEHFYKMLSTERKMDAHHSAGVPNTTWYFLWKQLKKYAQEKKKRFGGHAP